MTGKKYPNKLKAPALPAGRQSSKRKTIAQTFPAPAGSRPKLNGWREKLLVLSLSFAFYVLCFAFPCYAQENKPQPIIVNGDTVEYSTDSKEVIALVM